MADCSAARRPAGRRIRRTDGPVAWERESRAPKVSVSRYQDPLISVSALQDNRVRCGLHGQIPKVDSVMSRRLQAFGKERRQVVIDEKSHAVRRSGNYRSRTASAA